MIGIHCPCDHGNKCDPLVPVAKIVQGGFVVVEWQCPCGATWHQNVGRIEAKIANKVCEPRPEFRK